MWINAPSSVRKVMRTSISLTPSGRIGHQSALPDSTSLLSLGPSNEPPAARRIWRGSEVRAWPAGAEEHAVVLKRWLMSCRGEA